MHAPIHVVDVLKTDENMNSNVTEFIDKYIKFAYQMSKITLK